MPRAFAQLPATTRPASLSGPRRDSICVGITLFGQSHVGETLPNPLFPFGNAGGFFGLLDGPYADVHFDDIRAQGVVPEPATLLLLSGGLAALVTRRRRQL